MPVTSLSSASQPLSSKTTLTYTGPALISQTYESVQQTMSKVSPLDQQEEAANLRKIVVEQKSLHFLPLLNNFSAFQK